MATRWERERGAIRQIASDARMEVRKEHLGAAMVSRPGLEKAIESELDRKGVGRNGKA